MRLRKLSLVAGAATFALVLTACGGSSSTSTTTTSSGSGAASGTANATNGSSGATATDTETSSAAPAAGGDASSSGAPAVDPNADLVIWCGQQESAAVIEAGNKFGQDNGITVSVQVVAKDLQTNFVTASQAGQGPDIVLGAHDWIGNLVQNGTIDPVQMDAATVAKFNDLAIKGVTFNGQIYGVPFDIGNVFLVRNTDLAPTAPTSIEDMVKQGKDLVAAGKATEIMALPVGQNGDAYHMYPIYSSGGGYLFGQAANGDYDPKDLGLSKPEAVAAMTKIGDLGKEGALKTSISGDNLLPFFTDKKTAFMVTGPWNLPAVEKSGVPFDISPVPSFEGGDPAKPFLTIDAAYVASKGAHKTAAEEFALNYFATKDVAEALYALNPRPPALIEAFDDVAKTNPLAQKSLDAAKNGSIMPANPEMAAVWGPFGTAIANVVGGADPASTTKAAADTIAAAIK